MALPNGSDTTSAAAAAEEYARVMAEMTHRLRVLRLENGNPSLRQIAEDSDGEVAPATVSKAFSGQWLSREDQLVAIVRVLLTPRDDNRRLTTLVPVTHPGVGIWRKRWRRLYLLRTTAPPALHQPREEPEPTAAFEPNVVLEPNVAEPPAVGRRPLLLIARDCGLVLDTHGHHTFGQPNVVRIELPAATAQQLWTVEPSGVPGEVVIISGSNGFALDSTTDAERPRLVTWWELHKAPWQRWRLQRSANGLAFTVQAVHSGKFLTARGDSQPGWQPWFKDQADSAAQEWLFALPHDPTHSAWSAA